MKKCFLVLCLLFIVSATTNAYDLQKALGKLVTANEVKEQENLISEILGHNPPAETLSKLLSNIKFDEAKKKGIVLSENLCIDGIKRPFYWYIPKNYTPLEKTPLLVYLHGGVSRPEIIEDPETYIKESPFLYLAENKGYIILFPLGQGSATWWNSVGAANVLSQIRISKRTYNIDDDRIYMTGFSDGGSGSFFFSMCHPTDFAAFLPLNGHPGVASIDGGIQTYFANLFNRPVSVINTDKDALYPDRKIRPMIKLAIEAGANLIYRIYTDIGHEFKYATKEIPIMLKFMETHPRIANPPTIKWETVDRSIGRCMWLSIDKVEPGEQADWHSDHNIELVDDRLIFGFVPDDKYEGEGIKMAKVVDSTFCGLAGAKQGNVVIKVGNNNVDKINVLNDYKSKKKRGDPAEITILRDGKKIELKGYFPPPKKYMLFRREKPSARAEATFYGNSFHIRVSRLATFTIFIHPDMVQLKQNVVIYVNGEKIFDEKVEPDIEFMLRNFLENRDRELLYINKISITPDNTQNR